MGKAILTLVMTGALSASSALGGISLSNQSRNISIMGQVPGTDPGSSFSQSDDATTDLPFISSLQNSAGTGPVTTAASATQNSSFNLSGTSLTLAASGSAFGNSSDVHSNFSSASRFSLTFVLDTPANYQFSEHVSSDDEDDLGLLGADLMSAGQSLFGTAIPGLPLLNASEQPLMQNSGVLPAGTYTLAGGTAGNGNLTAINGSYAVSFSVQDLPQSIPLPATGWMGVVGLAVSGLAARRFPRGSRLRFHTAPSQTR